MTGAPVIMWFRRDLRLKDNTAFNAAIDAGVPVICVFVIDPNIMKSSETGTPRVAFLLKALTSLDKSLRAHGGSLHILEGTPAVELYQLTENTGATALYFNRDYSPYALRRDAAVEAGLNIPVYNFDDTLLLAPGEVTKSDGGPYTVFTPFKKKWLATPKAMPRVRKLDRAVFASEADTTSEISTFTLGSLGFGATIEVPDAHEAEAQDRLSKFIAGPIYNYEMGRNRLAADPDHDPVPGSSFLSAYLHLGLLSIRESYWAADQARRKAHQSSGQSGVDEWISELAWRDFFGHILFHFPEVTKGNFRHEYDELAWRHAPDELQAWKDGLTGYPVVDAAMRQLRQTGWMPNRARMIVASFLTKHLLIDWREGARHFMQSLVDGDVAANNGGWQWVAGTGTDAQPYFRIFNPVSQSMKFDKDGSYIRRWVPELRQTPLDYVHTPWQMAQPPIDYPPPLVDHVFARQRALDAYRNLKRR